MRPAYYRALLWLYRRLLGAYPRGFRATFGDEMEAVIAEALQHANHKGNRLALSPKYRSKE